MTTTEQRIRFAVIGAGVIGDVHSHALTAMSDDAELVAIADSDPDKALAMATKYGVAGHTDDVPRLLARDDIDAVTICTPSGLHADLAVAALDAGKHVVVEKPIDISLAAAHPRGRAAVRPQGRGDLPAPIRQVHRESPRVGPIREPGHHHLGDRIACLVAWANLLRLR